MSVDRLAAPAGPGEVEGRRERLARVAAEFEAMLLVRMLRDMRTAGSWDTGERDSFGAETFYETLDVELASYLARVQGFGLGKQLIEAYDRSAAGLAPAAPAGGAPAVGAGGDPARAAGTGFAPAAAAAAAAILPAVSADKPDSGLVLPTGFVTSEFGWRADPFHGAPRFHSGIDVRAAYGQDVRSAGAGRVVFSGQQGGYGTTVVVDHGNGVQTRYAHLSAALVAAGDELDAGQVLGRAGRSGRATGTHLHFEVAVNGRPVDPETVTGLDAGVLDQ